MLFVRNLIQIKKNPSADDCQERLGWMGSDHKNFDELSTGLGMDRQALQDSHSHASKPSVEGQSAFDYHAAAKKQESAEKELKKASKEKVSKVKAFDIESTKASLEPELKKMLCTLAEKTIKTIDESHALIVQVQGDAELKDAFTTATTLLEFRLKFLKAAADMTNVDTSETVWKKFLADTHGERAGKNDPIETLEHVLSFPELQRALSVEKVQFVDADSLKIAKNKLKETVATFQKLVTFVAQQRVRLGAMVKGRFKSVAALHEKNLKDAAKQRQDAARVEQAVSNKSKNKVQTAVAELKILESINKFQPTKKMNYEDFDALQATVDAVVIVKFEADEFNEIGPSLESFKTNFMKQSPSSGRGARQIAKTFPGMAKLDEILSKLACNDAEVVASFSPSEQKFIKAPWEWGSTGIFKGAGNEFAALGSVKINQVGDRTFVAASFTTCLMHYRTTVPGDANVSVSEVAAVFAEATAEQLKDLATQVFSGQVGPNEAVKLAPGWIIVEASLDNVPNFGWRCVSIPGSLTPSFSHFLEVMLPADFKEIKPTTTNAFLAVLVKALDKKQTVVQSLKLQLAIKKEACEPAGKRQKAIK